MKSEYLRVFHLARRQREKKKSAPIVLGDFICLSIYSMPIRFHLILQTFLLILRFFLPRSCHYLFVNHIKMANCILAYILYLFTKLP